MYIPVLRIKFFSLLQSVRLLKALRKLIRKYFINTTKNKATKIVTIGFYTIIRLRNASKFVKIPRELSINDLNHKVLVNGRKENSLS